MPRTRSAAAPAAVAFAAAFAVSVGAAAPATAATRALAPSGDVFAIAEGPYGELFPDGRETRAEHPVLAVAVVRPDGSSDLLLVPGTAGAEVERLSSLLIGPDGETLHVLWQSGAGSPSLRLASRGADGAWAEVVDVSRGVAVLPGSPRAAATRDSAEIGGEEPEAGVRMRRNVLHVVWLEEAGGRTIYAPLVIEDGAYIGDHPLFALDELAPAAGGAETGAAAPPEGAALGPAIEPGDDGAAAVAAFIDPANGRLVTVELRMVSGELSEVANRVHDEIVDLAATLEPGSPDSLRSLAGGARAELLAAGGRLRPALLQLLAGELEAYILREGSDWAFQPEAMAERTRGVLVEIGSGFDHAPIRRVYAGERAQMIGVGRHLEGPARSHDLRLRVAAERTPPPETRGPTSLFLSGDGEDALVAWEVDGVVHFRESDRGAESGWGPVRALGVTAGDDPSLIVELLRDRVRSR